jgi:peroxiredoxin
LKKQQSRLIIFALSLVLGLLNSVAFADINVGLKLDTEAPSIHVLDTQGKKAELTQLSGESGVILLFFRSADWCPYCQKQLIEVNQWHKKFALIGFPIAAVSYDSVNILSDFKKQYNIGFTLLADQSQQTINDYGIINQQYQPGDKHYGIPYPGLFVLDKQNKVIQKYFYDGYKNRVDLAQLYRHLKAYKR